jgi:hypothetical protein
MQYGMSWSRRGVVQSSVRQEWIFAVALLVALHFFLVGDVVLVLCRGFLRELTTRYLRCG